MRNDILLKKLILKISFLFSILTIIGCSSIGSTKNELLQQKMALEPFWVEMDSTHYEILDWNFFKNASYDEGVNWLSKNNVKKVRIVGRLGKITSVWEKEESGYVTSPGEIWVEEIGENCQIGTVYPWDDETLAFVKRVTEADKSKKYMLYGFLYYGYGHWSLCIQNMRLL